MAAGLVAGRGCCAGEPKGVGYVSVLVQRASTFSSKPEAS